MINTNYNINTLKYTNIQNYYKNTQSFTGKVFLNKKDQTGKFINRIKDIDTIDKLHITNAFTSICGITGIIGAHFVKSSDANYGFIINTTLVTIATIIEIVLALINNSRKS